jgi:autoinducer 2 (AI-2) kinase
MSSFVMGLDFGGGGGRCLLLDLHSGETVTSARAWRFAPAPGSGGLGFDLDLETVWTRLGEASREVLTRADANADQVLGVACTALRLGNVMLDASGAPLLAVPNRDARAAGPGLMLGAQHGEALYRASGRWPYPIHTAARLQWLRAEKPGIFSTISDVLSISDWLAFKLSGERATDPTQASETLLFDLAGRSWSEEWIGKLELPREIFPEVLEPGSRLGALTAPAAEQLGLRAGTPVAVGAADTQCGLLGAAALAPGDVALVAGSTGPIQLVSDQAHLDPEARLWTSHHLVPGHWVLESNCGPLGEALDWFARLLYPDAARPVVRLLGEAARSEPGARGLISSLGAEVMNARAMGLPVGQLTVNHLSSGDDPSPGRHLARAVVEGMACALRANLEQILELHPQASEPLRITGGLSVSPTFCALVSNVLDRPVRVTAQPGASALGAALCAATGAGLCDGLQEAAERWVRWGEDRAPDAENAEAHRALYERWTRMRGASRAADGEATAQALPFAIGAGAEADEAGLAAPRPRILVAADFDARSLAGLRELGDVTYASFREVKRMLTGKALVDALQGYSVFITEIDLVDAASLEQLPDLRVVGTCRGDAVNVDIAACTAFGIPVLNAPGRNADAVADLALGFLVMLARKFPAAERFLRAPGILPGDMAAMGKAFGTLQGRELWQKTVGLIGLGAVGRKVAERLQGFGARVIVSDPFVDDEGAALVGAQSVSLDTLLTESDFISLHAAVTPETTGLLGAAELARMKPGACLINTARAALVDEEALIAALQRGALAGAALDTFAVEPPGSDHPFIAMENVIATPHVGGNTVDVSAHQGEIMLGELRRMLSGQPPRHVLNPDSLPGFSWTAERAVPDAALLARLKAGPAPAVTDLQKNAKEKGETKNEAAASQQGAPAPEPIAASTAVPEETRTHMTALLRAFSAGIVSDPAIADFSADKDVTLHFRLTDLGVAFYFHLGAGDALHGDIGDPDENADVQLRLRAAVFDGMFTGTANPMEAAMDGRLSFTGDAAKAMTLQQMQTDLERLYRAAREQVGAPEGLDALPDPAAAAGRPGPSVVPANDPGAAGAAAAGPKRSGSPRVASSRATFRPRCWSTSISRVARSTQARALPRASGTCTARSIAASPKRARSSTPTPRTRRSWPMRGCPSCPSRPRPPSSTICPGCPSSCRAPVSWPAPSPRPWRRAGRPSW